MKKLLYIILFLFSFFNAEKNTLAQINDLRTNTATLDSATHHVLLYTGDWYCVQRDYMYHSASKDTAEVQKYAYNEYGNLIMASKAIDVFDPTRNIQYILALDLNIQTNQFDSSSIYQYEYDNNNKLTHMYITAYTYFVSQNYYDWVPSIKFTYQYDNLDNLIHINHQQYSYANSDYQDFQKYFYSYNTSNLNTGMEKLKWNSQNLTWDTTETKKITYDAFNRVDTFISMNVLYSGEKSIILHKYIYTNGDVPSEEIIASPKLQSTDWTHFQIFSYEYDSLLNRIQSVRSDYNLSDSSWHQTVKERSFYDLTYNESQVYAPYYFGNSGDPEFTYKLDSVISYGYNESLQLWKESSIKKYYYTTNIAIGADEFLDSYINIFPNPFMNHLQLLNVESIINFSLFDISGKEIYHLQLNGDQQIDTDRIPPGIYIYTIEKGALIKTGKLVKQ